MSEIEKKFINNVNDCVEESLQGLVKIYPGLYFHKQHSFITKSQIEITNQVAVISGGGSGHEPFCSGYVGDGMLAGAIAGNVFTSPSKSHILQTIHYLDQYYKGGVIVIIPNYTGDCLNFGMAVESAKLENVNVEAIIVGEDCASGENSKTGRRGMCGLVYVYKIAGALAAKGSSLKSICVTINEILNNVATLGITSKACSLPGQSPLFDIPDGEMELGTGVHGEAGIKKIKFTTAKDAVDVILQKMCTYINVQAENSVIVLINNLGSTTEIELNIICNEVYTKLSSKNIQIKRMYSGNLMTSLNMTGFQVSILRLPDDLRDYWIKLLDYSTNAPRWIGCEMSIQKNTNVNEKYYMPSIKSVKSDIKLRNDQANCFKECLKSVSQSLTKYEGKLNDLDSGCGDGDCGSTLVRFSKGIETLLKLDIYHCPINVLQYLGKIAETEMGGTSGAIYSLYFSSVNKFLIDSTISPLPIMWAKALKAGVEVIKKYGRVQIGDRTIIDSLEPAVNKFYEIVHLDVNNVRLAIKEALSAAQHGCETTKYLKAQAGRASYVNEERLKDVDAGAFGVVVCLEAINNIFLKA